VEQVSGRPRHRYTTALLAANPGLPKDDFASFVGKRLHAIPGSVPPVGKFPNCCRFRNRCEHESPSCVTVPSPVTINGDHRYSCWHPVEEDRSA
jgi:oligopeptide/dipeptide ABC transporter ATP-binding protein